MLIYETLLGLTPSSLRYLLQPSSSTYNTRSASHILLKVLKAHTSLGRSSFQFAAALDWNELRKTLKLDCYISISSFIHSLHSKTQPWTLLLTAVAASRDVLLSLPSCTLYSCLCMFVPCFVLLPCCAAAMLRRHVVLLPCCVFTCCCHAMLLS